MMQRRYLQESVRKIPGHHQGTPCLAVIDSAQLLFNLENILRLVDAPLDHASVGLWHDRGQSDSADVMQNARCVGKLPVHCAPLGDDCARDTMTPARPQ